jgi:predicted transcriptional regulator
MSRKWRRSETNMNGDSTSRDAATLIAQASLLVVSRYHECMTKQTTVRLPEELADQAEAVARVRGTSVNAVIVESLKAEVERVRADKDFTDRAQRLLERDRELLERLAH